MYANIITTSLGLFRRAGSTESVPTLWKPIEIFPHSSVIAFWAFSIVLVITCILSIGVVLLRTVYRIGFYGKQQMNTKYDVVGMVFGGGNDAVISTAVPEWSRYCDVSTTTIVNGDSITKELLEEINERVLSSEKGGQLVQGFVASREPSYVLVSRGEQGVPSMSNTPTVIASTPVSVAITGADGSMKAIPSYSLEYYPPNHDSDIFHRGFATLHFFQQSNTPQAQVSLFSTETPLWNVIPLCITDVFTYKIDRDLDYDFSVVRALRFFVGKPDNIRRVTEFIDNICWRREEKEKEGKRGRRNGRREKQGKSASQSPNVVITKELSDLLGLIEAGLITIVGCTLKGSIVAVLFFKDVSWKSLSSQPPRNDSRRNNTGSEGGTIELIGSVFDDTHCKGDEIRMACFSRGMILANKNLKASSIQVPTTSCNGSIVDVINNKKQIAAVKKTTRSYYLRNFRTRTRQPGECLIVV